MVHRDGQRVRYTAIVPARAGSKRLPNKNVMPLAGKPLLLWTLEACVQTPQIDRVILSTDSREYWALAKEGLLSPKLALDYRSAEEAGDQVKIFDYLKGSAAKIFADTEGSFILALPTVPLRRSGHIVEAIELYESAGQPIFSATTYGFPISFAFTIDDDGDWQPVFENSPMLTGNTRSQNQKATYRPNGAIYIRPIKDLSRPDLLTLYQDARAYLMEPRHSIDIDSEFDFLVASASLSSD